MLETLRSIAPDETQAALSAAIATAEQALAEAKPGLPTLVSAQRALCEAAAAVGVSGISECDVQQAFLQLTAEYEGEFFEDMRALNVLPPDAITRVSDYVPEVITYIQQIHANGYCYEANGSVYFDTNAFSTAKGHSYGKLDPSKVAVGMAEAGADWTEGKTAAELLAEGEGALSSAAGESEKRSAADFVLWKASKPGEPAWPSPWGEGRPGWHIECSTMASDLLGDEVDLNSGGADLRFPHHENQMAQAEAHYDCCSWVNYFLHSGHLQIEGLKMSKSLKNFVTVREALDEYSASQLRFLFLQRRFNEPMEFSANSMGAAVDLERRFATFSTSLGARIKEAAAAEAAFAEGTAAAADTAGALHKWGVEERELHATLVEKRTAVHAALQNSIDTPSALKALEQLLRATNSYMREVPDVRRGATLLTLVSRYFSKMMGIFGVVSGGGVESAAAAPEGSVSAAALAEALSVFRDQVRASAIAEKRGGGAAEGVSLSDSLLSLCDRLRDDVLPPLGVQVDDRASGVAQVQLGDPKQMVADATRRAEAKVAAAAEQEAKRAKRAAEAAAEAARLQVAPAAIFAAEHDELFGRSESYAEIDADGVPLSDAAGEPISKSARKKLVKLQQKHAKAYDAALKKAS